VLRTCAQELAENTSEIAGFSVLLTDEEGTVIGSNDPSRLGTLHSPSLGVMQTRRTEITTPEQASRLPEGVRPGITLPISFAGRVVGSIAIAGPPEEVSRYGRLVQKQAELLLRENALLRSSLLREQAIQELILEIASFDPLRADDSLLVMRGRELGYDLKSARTVVVAEILHPETVPLDRRRELQAIARRTFAHPQDLVARLGDDKIVILVFLGLAAKEEAPLEEVRNAASALAGALGEAGVIVTVGLGEIAFSTSQLGQAYRSAGEAAHLARRKEGNGGVFSIEELRLESLFSSIPRDRGDAFCETVLKRLYSCPDAGELIETFLAWCEDPFSPARVAANLSIHRNTLAYRLEKIGRLCALDLRKMRGILMLRTALALCKASPIPGAGTLKKNNQG
jgi:carbohydrate diacid regulator